MARHLAPNEVKQLREVIVDVPVLGQSSQVKPKAKSGGLVEYKETNMVI